MPKQKRRHPTKRDINGCHLKAGQQSMTPGQPVLATHVPKTVAPTHRHPDLQPLTLSGLADAFKLNGISFTSEMDGSYDCRVMAGPVGNRLVVTINPFDGAEVLQFFKDAIHYQSQPR